MPLETFRSLSSVFPVLGFPWFPQGQGNPTEKTPKPRRMHPFSAAQGSVDLAFKSRRPKGFRGCSRGTSWGNWGETVRMSVWGRRLGNP